MAAAIHSSTPPPPSSIHTPPTPRLGYDDNYQPYSPRKSTRVAQRSREAKTPPPQSQTPQSSHRTPRSSKASLTNMAPLTSSPPTASKKRAARPSFTDVEGRRVSGSLTYGSTASAAKSLGLSAPKNGASAEHQSTTVTRGTGMLPTPAKTPVKRPVDIAPAVTGIARNLFATHPDDEIMPSPKKKGRKKYAGITMDSFEVEEDAGPIAIFTDSNDRVPEVDNSLDNPFYGEGTIIAPEPTKRSSKRRKINVPGEGEQTVDELEHREDGLVYVFRGKKIFRKFSDQDGEEDEDLDAQLGDAVPTNLSRPLTRSSIKPRLLFAPPQQVQDIQSHNTEDEEADTDIEEPRASTPAPKLTSTPRAPKFAPASPPTTVRATRSRKLDLDSTPVGSISEDDATPSSSIRSRSSGAGSPFNQWQRVKPKQDSKKREAEPMTRRGGDKKVRA